MFEDPTKNTEVATPAKAESPEAESSSQTLIKQKARELLEKVLGDPQKAEAVMGNESLVRMYMDQHKRDIIDADDLDRTEATLGAGLARLMVGNMKEEKTKSLGIDVLKVKQGITEASIAETKEESIQEIDETSLPTEEELEKILNQQSQ